VTFLDFVDKWLRPQHIEERQIRPEISVQYVTHNQIIAKMTLEELLERNKDYKPAALPNEETLVAIRKSRAKDILSRKICPTKDTSSGPTYKVVECPKQPTQS